jgi:hypothetical protein
MAGHTGKRRGCRAHQLSDHTRVSISSAASPARHLQTPRATRARQTPRAPNTPVGERQWAWRLTDEQGRRLQQIMRRGKHGSIRVRRAMIIMASASGTLVPPKARSQAA